MFQGIFEDVIKKSPTLKKVIAEATKIIAEGEKNEDETVPQKTKNTAG